MTSNSAREIKYRSSCCTSDPSTLNICHFHLCESILVFCKFRQHERMIHFCNPIMSLGLCCGLWVSMHGACSICVVSSLFILFKDECVFSKINLYTYFFVSSARSLCFLSLSFPSTLIQLLIAIRHAIVAKKAKKESSMESKQ